MLLKLIAAPPTQKILTVKKNLTAATLQELAHKELNFSAARTRFIADQLYEGINFEKQGCAGLITYPHDREIFLTSERREPEAIKEFLTEYQFKLYNLIYSYQSKEKIFELDGTTNDEILMANFDALGVDWADFYSVGIASLIKRKYITAEDSAYKVTALGERVLDALNGFFDDVFSADSYNEVNAQVKKIAAGKAKKFSVIENYCAKFNEKFDESAKNAGAKC